MVDFSYRVILPTSLERNIVKLFCIGWIYTITPPHVSHGGSLSTFHYVYEISFRANTEINNGRVSEIRTHDLSLPGRAHGQTVLLPDVVKF